MRIKKHHRLLAGLLCLLLGLSLAPVAAATVTEGKLSGISVYGVNRAHYSSSYVTAVPQMLLDGVIGKDNNMWHLKNNAYSAHITFDFGKSVTITKLDVYSRLNYYDSNIKNFDLWLSDTAPTYADTTGGTAPSGLAATPTIQNGTLAACDASATYGTITLPENSCGRYLTLYIKNTYNTTKALAIQEMEFYGYKNEEPQVIPEIEITSVTEADGVVTVSGTTEKLGQRKVEIIVNEDLDLRYVAENDENGNFTRTFELPYNGEYTIEASVRDYSDFNAIRQTTPDENYFEMEGACTWGASPVKYNGLYYIIFSTWDDEATFSNWSSASQVGYAVSTKLGGPYIYQGRALDPEGTNITNDSMPDWGGGPLKMFHCPTMMQSKVDGKYYMYFISAHSSTQHIGVAYADTPAGPWTVSEDPIIVPREGNIDSAYVTNPTVIEIDEGDGEYSYYMIYRANAFADNDSGYVRASAYATAPTPLGPFTQSNELIMVNPGTDYSVEDCYVWQHNGLYYSLAKDMSRGGLTGYTGGYSYALYESTDGIDWKLSENRLAYPAIVPWESGAKTAAQLERAQLYIEDTIPFMSFNASSTNGQTAYDVANHTCNIQIPLLGVEMASDTYTLQITGQKDATVDKSALLEQLAAADNAIEKYYTQDTWWSIYTAKRAGKIIAERDSADQTDVDFATAELERLLAKRIDPWDRPVNIVEGKPTTATSVYNNASVGTFPAENLVDGNTATRWSAAWSESGKTVSIEIDLKGKYFVEDFDILQFAANIRSYNWEYYDGTSWKTCYNGTGTASTIDLADEFAFEEKAERLRLNITKCADGTLPSIWEIVIHGQYVSHNVALNKSITANSNYSATYTASKAVDGNATGTRWSAANNTTGTLYLEIDLAGEYYLDCFNLKLFDANLRITEYNWEYYDGTEWKTCGAGTVTTGSKSLTGEFTVKEAAQRIRFNMTKYATTPTIWEIEVFGSMAYGNVALNKPITANSTYDNASVGTFPAKNAVDGNKTGTRWSAANDTKGPLYLEIDLDGRYALDRFDIQFFDAQERIKKFDWEYYDGERWIACYDGTVPVGASNLKGEFTTKGVAERVRFNITEYVNTPTIYEIEVYGSHVRTEGVALDKNELALCGGQSATLTASIEPANASNRILVWKSSDEAVATVDASGLVTAVGTGNAVITVTTKEGGYTATATVTVTEHIAGDVIVDTPATATEAGVGHKECTRCGQLMEENIVIPATGEAMIDDQAYETIERALDAAKAGDTVKLMTDTAIAHLIVDPAVTIDLNGHTLETDYVIGFNGSVIGGEGKLIVDQNKVALDSANGGFLPVYEEDGYIFVNVNLENRTAMIAEKKFAFSPLFDVDAHEALLAGSAASGIKVVVRLNWEKADNYKAVQDFTYVDEMVKTVIESYDATKANYGEMFIAEFAGTEAAGAEGVTVSAVIISDTGVEIQSAVTEF